MTKRNHLMDILRSTAIFTVFLAHTILSYGAPDWIAPLQFGGTGVDLFFVLSGWLLGNQLFKEAENSGQVMIKRFWARRWLRTLPAYYAVLFASGVQRYLNQENETIPVEYFLLIQNYDYPLSFFSISWSLCVEEQFYLFIAPFVLVLSRINNAPYRSAILITLLITPFILRQLNLYGSLQETHVRIDGCLIGVLLAAVKHQHPAVWSKLIIASPRLALVGVITYILSYVNRYLGHALWNNPDYLVLALIFGSWVLFANSGSKYLNKIHIKGAQYIAERSYAIYLLHPEALAIMRRIGQQFEFFTYLLGALILSLIFAEVLYRTIERPFMNLREKISLTRANAYRKL